MLSHTAPSYTIRSLTNTDESILQIRKHLPYRLVEEIRLEVGHIYLAVTIQSPNDIDTQRSGGVEDRDAFSYSLTRGILSGSPTQLTISKYEPRF